MLKAPWRISRELLTNVAMLFVNVIGQPPWRGSSQLSVTVTSHVTRSEISGQSKISIFNLTTATGIVSLGTAAGEEPVGIAAFPLLFSYCSSLFVSCTLEARYTEPAVHSARTQIARLNAHTPPCCAHTTRSQHQVSDTGGG